MSHIAPLKEILIKAFNAADDNGDGCLSPAEVSAHAKLIYLHLVQSKEQLPMLEGAAQLSYDDFVKKVFDILDKNHDGKVTFDEAWATILDISEKMLGVSIELEDSAWMVESSGLIPAMQSYATMLHEAAAKPGAERYDELEGKLSQAFKAIDKDSSGFLEPAELKAAALTFSVQYGTIDQSFTDCDAKVAEWLKFADTNQDGKLSFAEVKSALLKAIMPGGTDPDDRSTIDSFFATMAPTQFATLNATVDGYLGQLSAATAN